MSNSDSLRGFITVVIVIGLLVGVVVLFVSLIKKSADHAREAENAVIQITQRIPADKQAIFMIQYNNIKKDPATAFLLDFFLGGIGIHKFYLGNTTAGIFYLLFCWTSIPGIIAFVELFTIAEKTGEYNRQKAIELSTFYG